MKKQKLSSSLATAIFKVILPCVIIASLFMSAVNEFIVGRQNVDVSIFISSPYILLGILVFAASLLISFQIKEVSIDDETLVVSNYIRKTRIPVEQILEFSETHWIKPKMIMIKLKATSNAGSRIVFIPTLENHGRYNAPIVREMNDFIAKRRMIKLVKS